MVEQLFGSKTRVKLLRLFYSNTNRSFYVREITRKIDEQINSVRRELANLLNVGIISSDTTDNKLYYEVNQAYEFYQPLSQIFGSPALAASGNTETKAAKTTAQAAKTKGNKAAVSSQSSEARTKRTAAVAPIATDKEQEELRHLGNVELVIYTGQFTRDELSGVDILIVGDINQTQLHNFITNLEAKEAKEIRYVVFTLDEYKYRYQIKDKFVSNILMAKKQVLIDKENLLSLEN